MRARLFVVLCLFVAACGLDPRRQSDPVGGGSGSDTGSGAGGGEDFTIPSILVLDFRSGWWAGSAGEFHKTVLGPLRDDAELTFEFHHFTVGSDVKCVYAPHVAERCETATMSDAPTPQEVLGRFDQESWNKYFQVWILSGSEKDMSDIRTDGDLFAHFVQQAGDSCTPIFIGAGDGFIDHANVMSGSLGIGRIMETQLANPGFFFGGPSVTVESRMMAGTQLGTHEIFDNVDVVADGVANPFLQHARGDQLRPENPNLQILAHDSTGRPVIAAAEQVLSDGATRPIIIDAGMQRYYASNAEPDTLELLLNIRRYLSSVGCRVIL
ncbi:MAG TPA: hypothetical protein VIV11_31765 [Kofleriaceae bacterium]